MDYGRASRGLDLADCLAHALTPDELAAILPRIENQGATSVGLDLCRPGLMPRA
jgi:hypothetical protein